MEIWHWVLSSKRDTILSHFSNNIFCWFAWSLKKIYVGCMSMHEFFFLFCVSEECIYECMKFDFFFKNAYVCLKFVSIWIFDFVVFSKNAYVCMKLCMNVNFLFCSFWRIHMYMHEIWFLNFLNENACFNA